MADDPTQELIAAALDWHRLHTDTATSWPLRGYFRKVATARLHQAIERYQLSTGRRWHPSLQPGGPAWRDPS